MSLMIPPGPQCEPWLAGRGISSCTKPGMDGWTRTTTTTGTRPAIVRGRPARARPATATISTSMVSARSISGRCGKLTGPPSGFIFQPGAGGILVRRFGCLAKLGTCDRSHCGRGGRESRAARGSSMDRGSCAAARAPGRTRHCMTGGGLGGRRASGRREPSSPRRSPPCPPAVEAVALVPAAVIPR